MLWNRGFGCSGWLLVGMFWFGTCEVHGDLCPLCLTTQVSITVVQNLSFGHHFPLKCLKIAVGAGYLSTLCRQWHFSANKPKYLFVPPPFSFPQHVTELGELAGMFQNYDEFSWKSKMQPWQTLKVLESSQKAPCHAQLPPTQPRAWKLIHQSQFHSNNIFSSI